MGGCSCRSLAIYLRPVYKAENEKNHHDDDDDDDDEHPAGVGRKLLLIAGGFSGKRASKYELGTMLVYVTITKTRSILDKDTWTSPW